MSADGRADGSVVKPSRRLLALFEFYLRWYIGRHFHGLRVAHGERFPRQVQGPTIVYLNHPSWWDPLAGVMISQRFLPHAHHYAPMDEAALKRYAFLARIGLFPVELNTTRGALQFLRAATEIVEAPNSVLWLTPQGCFTDPRQRPLAFKEGLAKLLSRLPRATLLPLALEYPFWDERLPEMLVNVGMPICIDHSDKWKGEGSSALLAQGLCAAQEELAALSIARDASRFEAILDGGAGVGGVYEVWQRMRSGMRGEPYQPEHGSIHRP